MDLYLIGRKNSIKYYKLKGFEAYNKNHTNFYNILRCIGRELHASNSARLKVALNEVKKRVRRKGHCATNTEIRNLIRARIKFTMIHAKEKQPLKNLTIHRISRKADLIFSSIFEIMDEIEGKNNNNLTRCFRNTIRRGSPCKSQMINNIDSRVRTIVLHAPDSMSDEVEIFANKIETLRRTC